MSDSLDVGRKGRKCSVAILHKIVTWKGPSKSQYKNVSNNSVKVVYFKSLFL
jgi:hypothetical protein